MDAERAACMAPGDRVRLRGFAAGVAVLSVCFAPALVVLVRFGFKEELYSHAVLIPAVAAYAGWHRRHALPTPLRTSLGMALALVLAGGAALVLWLGAGVWGWALGTNDSLCLRMLAFVCFVWAAAAICLGRAACRALLFPLGLLLFLVPMPEVIEQALTRALVSGSATCLSVMLGVTHTPYIRDGMVFSMPGLSVEIADACSGIRSTLVLFVSSVVAGGLYFETPWHRVVLPLLTYPIGVVRNALRVAIIALLTIHVDPDAINGPIHHHGGPPLFAISLIPFLLVFVWLVKSERRGRRAGQAH